MTLVTNFDKLFVQLREKHFEYISWWKNCNWAENLKKPTSSKYWFNYLVILFEKSLAVVIMVTMVTLGC